MRILKIIAVVLILFGMSSQAISKDELVKDELAGDLVLIPKGEFLMGSLEREPGSKPDERPQHRVTVDSPFYMGVYEVTNEQFRRFVSSSRYSTEAEKSDIGGWGYDQQKQAFARPQSANPLRKYSWKNTGFKQTDKHPVVNVSWNDAVAFCQWLTDKSGKHFYRLPTEVEWEYACRAGTATEFCWGNGERAVVLRENVADRSLKEKLSASDGHAKACATWTDRFPFSAPVGSFKPNPFGLFDIHGNVAEWCQDFYSEDRYLKSASFVPVSGGMRVFRGGAYLQAPVDCASARRKPFHATETWCNLGFRVVREAE